MHSRIVRKRRDKEREQRHVQTEHRLDEPFLRFVGFVLFPPSILATHRWRTNFSFGKHHLPSSLSSTISVPLRRFFVDSLFSSISSESHVSQDRFVEDLPLFLYRKRNGSKHHAIAFPFRILLFRQRMNPLRNPDGRRRREIPFSFRTERKRKVSRSTIVYIHLRIGERPSFRFLVLAVSLVPPRSNGFHFFFPRERGRDRERERDGDVHEDRFRVSSNPSFPCPPSLPQPKRKKEMKRGIWGRGSFHFPRYNRNVRGGSSRSEGWTWGQGETGCIVGI